MADLAPAASTTLSTRRDCTNWWTLVLTGINGWTGDVADAREGAIWLACQHYPVQVWSQRTACDVWRATRFLPTPGEVMVVFDVVVAELDAEVLRLAAQSRASARVWGDGESPIPYQLPPPPVWTQLRTVRGAEGPLEPGEGTWRYSTARLPIRTVEEQIAILRGVTPPVAANEQ